MSYNMTFKGRFQFTSPAKAEECLVFIAEFCQQNLPGSMEPADFKLVGNALEIDLDCSMPDSCWSTAGTLLSAVKEKAQSGSEKQQFESDPPEWI